MLRWDAKGLADYCQKLELVLASVAIIAIVSLSGSSSSNITAAVQEVDRADPLRQSIYSDLLLDFLDENTTVDVEGAVIAGRK